MITRAQQILLKRAQREACLSDSDYRDALAAVSGFRSSTDRAMNDRHVDLALAYFEAIFWRRVDAGQVQSPISPAAVFRQRGYWAAKNPASQTSRELFNQANAHEQIRSLEDVLTGMGFGPGYMAAIRQRATQGQQGTHSVRLYIAALKRTVSAKQRSLQAL